MKWRFSLKKLAICTKKEENIVYSFYVKLYTEDYKEFELFCRCFSKNRVRSAVIL